MLLCRRKFYHLSVIGSMKASTPTLILHFAFCILHYFVPPVFFAFFGRGWNPAPTKIDMLCGLCNFHISTKEIGKISAERTNRTRRGEQPPTRQSKVRSQVLSKSAKPYHSLASPLPHKACGLCGVPKSRKAFRGKEHAS